MLWLLPAAVLLAVLLCMTRAGVWAAYDQRGTLRLALRLGPLRIQLLPAKEKKPKKMKKKEPPKEQDEKKEKPEKKKLPFTREDIRDALRTLLPAAGKALRRTWQGVRVKPLRLSLTLGGQEDPAGTAQLCGELHAAVWGGMPLLERLVDVRDPGIHIGVDFESSVPSAEGEVGITFRIGTLISIGFQLAVPAVKWLLRCRKRRRAKPPEPEKKDEDPAA